MGIYDFEKLADNTNIFQCFKILGEFETTFKASPVNWSLKESKIFVDLFEKSVKALNLSE